MTIRIPTEHGSWKDTASFTTVIRPFDAVDYTEDHVNQSVKFCIYKLHSEMNCARYLSVSLSLIESANDPKYYVLSELRDLARTSVANTVKDLRYRGEYPIIREFADLRLGTDLVYNPSKEIPGWVFPRWNKAHPGQKALKDRYGTDTGGEIVPRKVVAAPLPKRRTNVKKPVCPMHSSTMEFDAEKGNWKCPEPGCVITARPKREGSEPVIGKGVATIHAVVRDVRYNPARPNLTSFLVDYFVVSDDNVMVNISNLMAGGIMPTGFQAAINEAIIQHATTGQTTAEAGKFAINAAVNFVIEYD